MILDLSKVEEKVKLFRKLLPGVKLFYAMKCNDDPGILALLKDKIDGFDVASFAEIKKLLALGVSPEVMAFSNPVKIASDVKEAYQAGVRLFAFQSKAELLKLKENAPGSRVYLRLKVADDQSELSFSQKFGAEVEDALELCKEALKQGHTLAGLTFHVGSQAENNSVWQQAIIRCAEVAATIKDELGCKLEFINIGGGLPVQYATDHIIDIEGAAQDIIEVKEKHFPDVSFMAEPGRFLVGEAGTIVSSVIGVETRKNQTWLFLDVGAFQAFVEIFEFGYFPYPISMYQRFTQNEDITPYVLTGPSCDSYDTLTFEAELPEGISIGDNLQFSVTGAYTLVYGSTFNSLPIPEVHYKKEGKYEG